MAKKPKCCKRFEKEHPLRKYANLKEYAEKELGWYYKIESPGDHVGRILEGFIPDLARKYRRGQNTHGGKLYRKNVVEKLRLEVYDLAIYWMTLWWQIELVEKILEDAHRGILDKDKAIEAALNVIWMGNPEGEDSGEDFFSTWWDENGEEEGDEEEES